jgi:hypothetical protein
VLGWVLAADRHVMSVSASGLSVAIMAGSRSWSRSDTGGCWSRHSRSSEDQPVLTRLSPEAEDRFHELFNEAGI